MATGDQPPINQPVATAVPLPPTPWLERVPILMGHAPPSICPLAGRFPQTILRLVLSCGPGVAAGNFTSSGEIGPRQAAAASSRLVNLSARAWVGTGSETLIAGFVVAGEAAAPAPLLLRGVGPTLAGFGVAGNLADPVLTLAGLTGPNESNDDWGSASNASLLAAVAAGVGAFALPDRSLDAVLYPSVGRGAYSVNLTGKGGGAGVALIEVYDAAGAGARLANLSVRARVGSGAETLTAGFVIDGTAPKTVLIRAIGPSLASFGLTGALADPQLAVFRAGASVSFLQNDNWGGGEGLQAAFAATGAFALADTSKDAALLATLEPGGYSVQVSGGGAAGIALVEIYDATAAAVPPSILGQPSPLTVPAGASASLTVIASSATPLGYQWRKDGVPLAGATTDTLHFASLQAAQAGTYTATVTNSAGAATSAPVTVSLIPPPAALPPAGTFNLVGFATLGTGTTGGGLLAPGDPNYRILDASVANRAQQLRTWLESTTPLVVDIQVDVDLGALNNVGARPKTNPELIASGVGVINVRANKTVFSSTGATLRHGTLNLSGQNNIIVRNLRFRGLWEFDEGSQNAPDNSPWGYKIQDWDYIDIQNGAKNVWIDHCDFEKSYDGIADTKAAADLITFSWCRLGGDTEGAVARQISYLEKLYQGQISDSRITFTFYKGLRDGAYAAQGLPRQTVQSILDHERAHDKCNLVGSADTATGDIGYLNLTFHHLYYHGCRQRLPRMRFGNAHVFNLFVDNSIITEGTNMATATTCDAAVFAENCLYLEVADPFPPQSGTSPAGALAQSGCRWIYQKTERSFAGNLFLKDPAAWRWNTGTKNFVWGAAPPPNARALPYSYQADPVDFTPNNLAWVGVIVPATPTQQATLAGYLVRTTN